MDSIARLHQSLGAQISSGPVTRRLFIDVTRTHSSTHHSGIQKVVRGLYRALRNGADPEDLEIVPVLLTPRGATAVATLPLHPFELQDAKHEHGANPHAVIRLAPTRIDRLRTTLMAHAESSLLSAAALAVLRVAARLLRITGRLKARFASPPPVRFAEGDILLMPDTAWQIDPWPAVAQAKSAGARVAAIWYDLIPLTQPDHFHPELPGPFLAYFRRMLEKADLMIAISAAVEAEIADWAARLDLAAPALGHAWPGVRLSSLAPRRPEIDIILKKPTILIVATLEPRKGHDLLLDACEALWQTTENFNLLIAGRIGWRVERLFERLRRHERWNDGLYHFDDLSDGEIVDLYSNAAVLAFPSLAEGYGLPIVEAELAGCPTVVSDLPVFREIASPATHVFAPRTAEALAAALKPFVAGFRGRVDGVRDPRHAGFERYAAEILSLLDNRSEMTYNCEIAR